MRDARFRRVRAPGYRLDFLFLVSCVIITLPGHLFRGTAATKGNEAPMLRRDDQSLFQIMRSRVLNTTPLYAVLTAPGVFILQPACVY